jgi:hypothetical protein
MWRGDLEADRMHHRASLTRHDGEVKGLNDVIAGLEQKLAERAPVRVDPDQQKVWDAQAQASKWRGLRDDAFRVLARLRGLHHDPGNGRCICRKPVGECPETRLLNDARSFLRWEADQTQRYWQSRDCSLPDGHPALVNHKWPAPGSALP